MQSALDEIKRATEYNYIVINNDIATAVDDIIAIIRASALNIEKQNEILNEVLEKC